MQYSDAIRNARLAADETTVGTGPVLQLRTGAAPANCAAARTGTIIARLVLPSDWQAAPSGGAAAKSGTWEDLSADNSGTPAHFSLMDSGETTCHMQGTVGQGTGELQLNNTTVVAGQTITITSWVRTAGGA